AVVVAPAPPRLGMLRWLVERATPEMGAHIESVAGALRTAGALVSDVSPPPAHDRIHQAGNTVQRAEAATYHATLFERHAAEYGRTISAVDYLAAQEIRRASREEMAPIAARYDALLLPTAGAPTPRGLGSTGDPYFCIPWSSTGMPAIALPSGVDAAGLPLS